MTTPDYRAALAPDAYTAFVQICKGNSDDAGTYLEDEELVRRALKRLDELERSLLAAPEAVDSICTGCGTPRHKAIAAVANGAMACCPDCSTLTVADRNAIREAVAQRAAPEAVGVAIQPPGRTGLTWEGVTQGLRDVLADKSEDALNRVWQRSRILDAVELIEVNAHPAPVPVGERPWEREGWCDDEGSAMIGSMNDPRAYDQFISITADGGNIGTLNWTNNTGGWTAESWPLDGRTRFTYTFGAFRWTTPKWTTIRITRGLARYTPILWDGATEQP